jgi:hypothetical protein
MQEPPLPTYIHCRTRVAVCVKNGAELTCALFVGTRGQTNEEMFISLTDISTVHRSGGRDLRDVGAVCLNRLSDQLNFTQPRGRAGSRDYCHVGGQNRRIFNKCAVGIF